MFQAFALSLICPLLPRHMVEGAVMSVAGLTCFISVKGGQILGGNQRSQRKKPFS